MATITWVTTFGLIGVYPASVAMQYFLEATVSGGTIIDYKIISGSLPSGLSLRSDGKIYGTPNIVSEDTTSTFVVRVTADDDTVKDRTFELTITGVATPRFTTPSGLLLTTQDSTWVELPILYSNPVTENPVSIRVLSGELPPGLEINSFGLIRGYAKPPIIPVTLPQVTTIATQTFATNDIITVLSTNGFRVNRPVIFTGTAFGGIVSTTVYYVKEIIDATHFTISSIPNGDVFALTDATGILNVTLPATETGDPTKIQYFFTLELLSPRGNDRETYSITVINHTLPVSQGGPGGTEGTRPPTIYNTRPPTFNIDENTVNYGYYVLPPVDSVAVPGTTYAPTDSANIGQFLSGNFFSFHVLGYDYDNFNLTYTFPDGVPSGLTANSSTGWIYGEPTVSFNNIQEFTFRVKVSKTVGGITIDSPTFKFKFRLANNINGDIVWITDSDLGNFDNASISYQNLEAESDVPLNYSLMSGNLPPNLTLTSSGELTGIIAYQPATVYTEANTTNEFEFTVNAYAQNSSLSTLVYSTKTFSMSVNQKFDQPTDNLYIKCTPTIEDRNIIASLLGNTTLIPTEYLYRSDDANFGKAQDVVYAHAFGIDSSNINQYIEAVQKNHYWRDITLGSLSTAVAKDINGNIIYEVVYSNVVDNLMKYDPNYGVDYRYAISISEEIYWPRFIDLHLGPWYTSSTEIYTSYIFAQDAYIITNFTELNVLTQDGIPLLINQGIPTFYTSLTPDYARILYPNSLANMRKRVEQDLGTSDKFDKYPLWMTSQQSDGNTLGFTPAWVICYTKPAPVVEIEATQTLDTLNAVVINSIDNLIVGGQVVFTGPTFGNILSNQTYYVKTIGVTGYPTGIVLSATPNGNAVSLLSESGIMTGTFYAGSYAEIIKNNIETNWEYTLNEIDFQIDRFTVDKQLTYDFDNNFDPNIWIGYPSATPVPNPLDSENFYVLFPRKTILPTKTQYNL